MLWGMCVTYTRLLPNFSLVGHTTNYGYNAQWLPETITDAYNTIATPSWHRYTTTPMPRAKANRTFCKPRRDRFGRKRKFLSIFPQYTKLD